MALIKCPECGRDISDKAINCIHCGYPLADIKQQESAGDVLDLAKENELTNENAESIEINEDLMSEISGSIVVEKKETNYTGEGLIINEHAYAGDTPKQEVPKKKKHGKTIAGFMVGVIILIIAVFALSSPSEPALEEVTMPNSGHIFFSIFDYYEGDDMRSELTVDNNSGEGYYIKLWDNENDMALIEFFMRPYSECTVEVPAEALELRYACGTDWYGEEDLFGNNTAYYKNEELYDFANYTWTITFDGTAEDGSSFDVDEMEGSDF